MAKAKSKKQNNRADPISKKSKGKPKPEGKAEVEVEDVKPAKDPKDSHLYTDDNPETTLQGTGFKDAATADKTSKYLGGRCPLRNRHAGTTPRQGWEAHVAQTRRLQSRGRFATGLGLLSC